MVLNGGWSVGGSKQLEQHQMKCVIQLDVSSTGAL